jgi:uncharacterized protein with PIN domain/sulfur carrier protein ThiS
VTTHVTARVAFHGTLGALTPRAGDGVAVGIVHEPRSVKDLIESLGVPHTEVAHVTVDGRPVEFDERIVGGEHVDVHPPGTAPPGGGSVTPPPAPDRFVCDVHLGTLARRLRLLGFDTWYRNDAGDADLARVAVDEQRTLLTRDRGLLQRRAIVHGYLPRSDDPDQQLVEVIERFDLVGHAATLTRCVPCNGLLDEVPLAEVADQVPPRSRAAFDRFARCRRCGQIFWPGSHLDALTGVLTLAEPIAGDTGQTSSHTSSQTSSSTSSGSRPR